MLFGRQSKFQIGKPGQQGLEFKGFTFSWKIKHTSTSKPNKATIKIFNLDESNIESLREPDTRIRIFSGYSAPKLLFSGEPIEGGVSGPKVQNEVESLTEIEAMDGGLAYANTQLGFDFSSAVSVETVWDEIVDQMGLPTGRVEFVQSAAFPNGITFAGKAKDALDRVSEMSRSKWSIQDGRIQLVSKEKGTQVEVAQFSREKRTIIGNIERTKEGIRLRVLTDEPSIRPEDRFSIADTDHAGIWRIKTLTFEGSSGWEKPNYANIDAVEP